MATNFTRHTCLSECDVHSGVGRGFHCRARGRSASGKKSEAFLETLPRGSRCGAIRRTGERAFSRAPPHHSHTHTHTHAHESHLLAFFTDLQVTLAFVAQVSGRIS